MAELHGAGREGEQPLGREGTTWTKVASPNPSPFANQLFGVAATSSTNTWAVGTHPVVENFLTLAVHAADQAPRRPAAAAHLKIFTC